MSMSTDMNFLLQTFTKHMSTEILAIIHAGVRVILAGDRL